MKTILRRTLSAVALAVCILFFSNSALAYDAREVKFLSAKTDTGWTLQSDVNGVKAYYQVSVCDSLPVVVLKFINSNNYDVKLVWDNQVKIATDSYPTIVNATPSIIVVAAGQTVVGACSDAETTRLLCKPNVSADKVIESFVFSNFSASQYTNQ